MMISSITNYIANNIEMAHTLIFIICFAFALDVVRRIKGYSKKTDNEDFKFLLSMIKIMYLTIFVLLISSVIFLYQVIIRQNGSIKTDGTQTMRLLKNALTLV